MYYLGRGGQWHARFSVDSAVYKIKYSSLDAHFMKGTIRKCLRNHSRLIPVPKGRAVEPSADHQLSRILPSELGTLPGNLYNVHCFCQRNSFLLAFRNQYPASTIQNFIQHTPDRAYLDETFANLLRQHMGVTTEVRDDLVITS